MEYKKLLDKVNKLEIEVNKLTNEKTCISLREYYELLEGLKPYKNIIELKPVAEVMEREINRLNVWA